MFKAPLRTRPIQYTVIGWLMHEAARVVRGQADQAMDGVNIKISKFGGLTKAKLARDLCASFGIDRAGTRLDASLECAR